ncbi:unnamed protein product, partial [Aphanomyces euteiches]
VHDRRPRRINSTDDVYVKTGDDVVDSSHQYNPPLDIAIVRCDMRPLHLASVFDIPLGPYRRRIAAKFHDMVDFRQGQSELISKDASRFQRGGRGERPSKLVALMD